MIAVVIPVLNEEKSIGLVAKDLITAAKAARLKIHIIVCDNGSTDNTAKVAKKAGCQVVTEPARGYGAACLRALTELPKATKVVLFIDGDYSDFPEEFPALVRPILSGATDLVIGSRTLPGPVRERGALTVQQRFGNWLATFLIRYLFGQRYTDLGPFRAISRPALEKLKMQDRNFGWTVEMQIRAAKHHLRIAEIPVSYRKRIGVSKISGTVKGTILAGYIILRTIFTEFLRRQ